MEIVWKRGEFLTFYANLKIRIGGKEELTIHEGDSFEYDGQVLRYSGLEVSSPHLRQSIKNGWASFQEGSNEKPQAVIPTRNRAAAQSVNTDLSSVKRVGKGSAIATSREDEETVLNVSDRRESGSGSKVLNVPSDRREPKVMTHVNNRRSAMLIREDEYSSQEGETVGKVRTSAKLIADVSTNRGASLANDLENLEGSGLIDDRDNEKMTTTRHAGGIVMKSSSSRISSEVNNDSSDSVLVGKVRKQSKTTNHEGGITVTDTSSRGNAQKTNNESKPAKIDTKIDPRVRIARSIDSNFPSDWKFEGKLAERLARVHDHGVSPQFLEALYAAEGDQMRKLLQKEFPGQFS